MTTARQGIEAWIAQNLWRADLCDVDSIVIAALNSAQSAMRYSNEELREMVRYVLSLQQERCKECGIRLATVAHHEYCPSCDACQQCGCIAGHYVGCAVPVAA